MTIGIIASVAVPSYRDYTIREQVSEVLHPASAPQAAATKNWPHRDTAP